ncbi:hypothetical protein DSCW_19930 [Desulfosarcina widdelii]|uniref:Uncharacterized protein n=1 Tax=Desulfosarcina widdelii TaxID=947919 RepID=A0A5K7YYW7_9BACT|nr:hypothetical protein DSCW_19930 [Desulfosarcina widdelii]
MVYPRLIVLEAINRPTIGKDTRTMSKDNVVELKKPDVFVNDPISEWATKRQPNLNRP